ncbi:MAG: ribonuclease PH [Promethearchaeota archaeon]
MTTKNEEQNNFIRIDGRRYDELRPYKITMNYLTHPISSCLIEMGKTKVIIAATIESTPRWMKDSGDSWITAEYGLMPGSVEQRAKRPVNKQSSRAIEIQRLIGRALRGAFNLENIGEISMRVDCDVMDADGGTRCASITGAYVVVYDAFRKAFQKGLIKKFPETKPAAAISIGIKDGRILLDLNYEEDSSTDVDANFVMNEDKEIIEIQATSEGNRFTKADLIKMLDLAEKGISELIEYQKKILNLQ